MDSVNAEREAGPAGRLGPGLALAAACVILALLVHRVSDSISPLVIAVVLGTVLSNLGLIPDRAGPGLQFAAKRLLRLGVVLLGFQLGIAQMAEIGIAGLAGVVLIVSLTFFGTLWAGRRLRLTPGLTLLIATGFSICGASAIAATKSVSTADDDDTAASIALVTLCGSLAIVVLPPFGHLLGLDPTTFGMWVGASVHDVGQVVAASATAGGAAISAAVLVKLTRVLLLAPLVAGVSLHHRAKIRSSGNDAQQPPIIPLFVVGFLVTTGIRSMDLLPLQAIDLLDQAKTIVFALALVGLGAGVQIKKLRRFGPRPLVLALISWFVIAASSLSLVLLYS